MKVTEVKQSIKSLWENFNKNSPNSSFLQSYSWGDFQASQSKKIIRFAVEESKSGGFTTQTKLIAIAQTMLHPLPFGRSYFYIPHGPIIAEEDKKREAMQEIINKIKELAPKEKASFLFMEPTQNFDDIPFLNKSQKHIQTETTIVLDISKSKKELLGQMKSKTRYNIKLSRRRGVEINVSKNLEDVGEFLRLAKPTSERDEFKLHPDNYYRDMMRILSGDDITELLLAKYKNKIIAAIIVIYYGDTATYLHGASDYNYRNLMATHLLQWKAIKRARKKGCKNYDFWGVAPTSDPEHKWAGFSRFKKGFAPKNKVIKYPGPYEYPINSIETQMFHLIHKVTERR